MLGKSLLGLALLSIVATSANGRAADSPPKPDGASVEFFEKEVRPVLANRCQGCHGQAKQKGGLRLDSRGSALAGGDSGPAVVPGKPAESLLVEAITYGDQVQMPPKTKLPPAEVATLTRWVASGAPWPVEERKTAAGGPASPGRPWKERENHWRSFRPARLGRPSRDQGQGLGSLADRPVSPRGPRGQGAPSGPRHRPPDVDSPRQLRHDRTSTALTTTFVGRRLDSNNAFEKVVDRLLASPRYGERWARHWLDLVRYAETSGHEFDYEIPDAWRYRDYVIRAFNSDVPYDQFVIEHLAGDLLPEPRRNPAGGTNESILATGFYFMGEGTHSPVDLREEEAGRIDGQIDTIGKAFLGLTIARARCHDHRVRRRSARRITTPSSGFLKKPSRLEHAFLNPPALNAAATEELRTIRAAS